MIGRALDAPAALALPRRRPAIVAARDEPLRAAGARLAGSAADRVQRLAHPGPGRLRRSPRRPTSAWTSSSSAAASPTTSPSASSRRARWPTSAGCGEDEQARVFFDYWTLKEAYIKARGMGLALPLAHFAFSLRPPALPTIRFDPEIDDDEATWQFAQSWPTEQHRLAAGGAAAAGPRSRRAHRGGRARRYRREALGDCRPPRRLRGEPARRSKRRRRIPDDWLIVAGDAGDTPAQLDFVLRTLTPRFRQLVWVPGNHDLWTPRDLPARAARRRPLRAPGRAVPALRRADAGGSFCRVARRRAARAPSCRCSCSTTTRSRPTRSGPKARCVWARQGGRALGRRGAAGPASLPVTRGAWCHARVRAARGPARGAARRRPADPGQPLPAARGPRRAAAHPALPCLVRHAADRGLAPPLQRGGGDLRPPAPARLATPSTACASKRCRSATRGSGIRRRGDLEALPARARFS